MSDVAIRAEGLGKQYTLGGSKERYPTLRDQLAKFGGALRRGFRRAARPAAPPFWALKDVSFEVRRGEVVGIIGRNGAGKSTLLKILSRITEPTEGEADILGRVGSLLEVGTGFHPELTGRENVYLNGAILGMRRAEIVRQFDAIVAFAEVEKFVDTPVKHYSSGMYTRLAFAVAAHLEPEILIVDEVLAVGDQAFQKRCLGKMGQVAKDGRTVLFVSHDMTAVTRLCTRALLFDGGTVRLNGDAWRVVNQYTQTVRNANVSREWTDPATAPGDDVARLTGVRFRTSDGSQLMVADTGTRIGVEMRYEVLVSGIPLVPNIHFFNGNGVCLFVAIDGSTATPDRPRPAGRYVSTVWVPAHLMAEGELRVSVALTRLEPQKIYFHEQEVLSVFVTDAPDSLTRGGYTGAWPGVVRPLLDWTTDATPLGHPAGDRP